MWDTQSKDMMAGQREGTVTFDTEEDDRSGRCGCCKPKEGRRCKCSPSPSCVQTLLLLFAVAAGVGTGVGLRYAPPFQDPEAIPQRYLMYLYLPAELLLRLIHFLSIPLIALSVLTGIGGLTTSISVKVFCRGFLFFLGTSILAAGEGIGLVLAIQPNSYVKSTSLPANPTELSVSNTTVVDAFLDIIRNLFPNNFLTAGLELTSTRLDAQTLVLPTNETFTHETRWLETNTGDNVMGILFFATVFGFGTAALAHRRRPLVIVADLFFEVVHSTYRGIVWLYPIMVFFMMVCEVVRINDPVGYIKSMFVILLTVLLTLVIHVIFILPLIYLIAARRNPFKVLSGSLRALFTALLTNDSMATLPVTIDCLEKLHIHPRVARFIAPTGALMNLHGFIIYQTITVVFLAVRADVNPAPGQLVILGFLAVAVSLLAPVGTKHVALLLAMCKLFGVSALQTALLMPFQWLMERFCAVADVWGDCIAAGIIQVTSQPDLLEVSNPTAHMNGELCPEEDQTLVDEHGCPIVPRYRPNQCARDWTVRLVNEEGDRLVVSKV